MLQTKDIARYVVYAGIFLIPFIPLLITNSLFFPYITGKNFAFRIIVEIICAAYIILALYNPQYRPRFSWVLVSIFGFLGIIGLSNIFGVDGAKSFWSNFERMEGYITLLHLGAYALVAGSVMHAEKLWNRFFNISLAAAMIGALYTFAQLAGMITINQGGVRIDGTLGNASFLAIYMLFHVFIAGWMYLKASTRGRKVIYAAVALICAFVVLQTATRGTILGLVGGGLLSALYIGFFGTSLYPKARIGIAVFIGTVILLGGSLFVARDTAFVSEHPILSRIASISLSEGSVRFAIWSLALEGVEERPLLGWGQGNFEDVFNKYYDPALHSQEPWFDRAHNVLVDWLVAGGVLGFIAYLSLFVSVLYYVVFLPLIRKKEVCSVGESAIILGLLGGYTIHNLFVFDNLVSYILFFSILALVHARVSEERTPWLQHILVDKKQVAHIVTPLVVVILCVGMYMIHVPAIQAAHHLAKAVTFDRFGVSAELPAEEKTLYLSTALQEYQSALQLDTYGNKQIRENLMQAGRNVVRVEDISEELKNTFISFSSEQVELLLEENEEDPRSHLFAGSYYRSLDDIDRAFEELESAHELSPRKQIILFEIAFTHMQEGEYLEAQEYFKEAFELDTSFNRARVFYAMSSLYVGNEELIDELIVTYDHKNAYVNDDRVLQTFYNQNRLDAVADLLEGRIELWHQKKHYHEENVQAYVSLAAIYYQIGNDTRAIEVLEMAIEDYPQFLPQGQQFIEQIRSGTLPRTQ